MAAMTTSRPCCTQRPERHRFMNARTAAMTSSVTVMPRFLASDFQSVWSALSTRIARCGVLPFTAFFDFFLAIGFRV